MVVEVLDIALGNSSVVVEDTPVVVPRSLGLVGHNLLVGILLVLLEVVVE